MIKKNIVTAMKTEVIKQAEDDLDISPSGIWCTLEHRPVEMPEEVWVGPGTYAFTMGDEAWCKIKFE